MSNKKEIGGYFELDTFLGEAYHKQALALNCGRGCIRYLAELRKIKKIWVPDLLCDSAVNAFKKSNVEILRYTITKNLRPDYQFEMAEDEWLLLVDYYGQLTDEDISYAGKYAGGRVICDETHGFFRKPTEPLDTFYSCRKWFGVADGAYLITGDGAQLDRVLELDESGERMSFVLGRYERPASEYFAAAKQNNEIFEDEPAKRMSLLTQNLLRAIDYEKVAEQRRTNWDVLDGLLKEKNQLKPIKPEVPFMYPFFLDDVEGIREKLAEQKIYIPTLWPNVLAEQSSETIAYQYAKNILPLPVDQRYTEEEMERIVGEFAKII
ncbi:MAG: hypothetical protein K6G13_08875 [Agathobacter sp.]|uniref:hypothetical protein n=1 Tax=Agathobacter sp. TaxID=2021311 RepID=UPI00258CE890|nr:hypothetical protein [Agathobacter sp.]MCR5678128.1 hypothetical protein [Agathobacter sp.]